MIINSISPMSGDPLSAVHINGAGFTQVTSITINGVNVPNFAVLSDTDIDLAVPQTATTGTLTITDGVNSVSVNSSSPFTVTNVPDTFATPLDSDGDESTGEGY